MSLLLDDIRTCFAQFPFGPALFFSAARLASRVLDGQSGTTYSQFGEDRVLPFFLPATRQGFYVDVGAGNPVHGSNTFSFYKRGWRGITIEANHKLVAAHRRLRRKDQQVEAVVSDQEIEMEFTEFENDAFSTVSAAQAKECEGLSRVTASRKLRARTLTTILQAHQCPAEFALLCVDVESHDLAVLRSLDWHRYHPQVVLVEIPELAIASLPGSDIFKFLAAQAYTMVAYDGYNGYFMRSELTRSRLRG